MPRKAEILTGKTFGYLTVIERDFTNTKAPHWKCKCICGRIVYPTTFRLKSGKTKSCGCMTNVKDISKQRFGRLITLHRDKNDGRKYVCLCDCGNTISVFRDALVRGSTNSCGCLHSEIISKRFIKDLTGLRFGRLVVVERNVDMPKSNGVYWKCICDCGNIVSVISRSLTKGYTKSCGCLKSEITSKLLSHNLIGKTFGRLTVIGRCENDIVSSKIQYSRWLCRCKCGSMKKIRGHDLVSGKVCSCGCLISKGEEMVRIELNKKNISFETQYWFDNLRSDKNYPLKFDFAIFDKGILKCLIEYQGEQHFNDYDRGDFGKQQREITDKMKKDYCNKNNIKLYEIRYDENISQKIEEILNM